jgi:hypothetical protein
VIKRNPHRRLMAFARGDIMINNIINMLMVNQTDLIDFLSQSLQVFQIL